MKNIFLIALVLTLATSTVIAGQKGNFAPPPHSRGNPVERLTEQLGLDVDQVAAITVIFEESRTARDEERQAFQEGLCGIRSNTNTQILAELTPEQQGLYNELRKKHEALKAAIEEVRQEHGYGGGSRMMDCEG